MVKAKAIYDLTIMANVKVNDSKFDLEDTARTRTNVTVNNTVVQRLYGIMALYK